MERIFNAVKFLVLGLFSGIFYMLSDMDFTRNLLVFVMFSSMLLSVVAIITPGGDDEIRQHKVNRFLGRE
jgi:hypothetical protein